MPTVQPRREPAQDDPFAEAEALKAEADRQLFIVPKRAMALAERISQLGWRSEEPSLQALGVMTGADALREQGHYAEALGEYDRAGRLYLSVGDEVGWARTRVGAASTRAYTAELGPALQEVDRARGILQGRGLWVRLARLESASGKLLHELGRLSEALLAHERAAGTAQRVANQEERELLEAEVQINRAMVYHRLDQYDRAEQLLRTAAETFRRYARPGPVAIAESNLARGLIAQGHVSRALAVAGEVRRAMLGLGRIAHAAIAGQVAVDCLLELNRLDEATRLANEIVRQLTDSGASGELAKTLLQRAVAFERQEQDDDAAADLAQAESLFRDGGCRGWAAVARLHRAELLDRRGQPLEALAAATDAGLELRRRLQPVAGARAELVRASAWRKLGHPEKARAAALTARRVARSSGVPLLEYHASRVLGEVAEDQGKPAAALRAYAAAIGALERTQGRIMTEQRAGFLRLQDKLRVYEAAIRLSVQAGRARQAFIWAERSKARALLDALALRSVDAPTESRAPHALLAEFAAQRRRYDALSAGTSGEDELERCEARLSALREELRLTEAHAVPHLEALQGKVHSPIRYLGEGTALVQYAVSGDDIFIFVLRRGQRVEVRLAPAGAADQVLRLQRLFALNLQTVMGGRHSVALQQQARALLQRLHALLIDPVADLIGAQQRLVIVPHGLLHGIPFAALFDGSSHLIERYELALAPSASAISFWRRRRTSSPSRGALVIGHSAGGHLPGALDEGRTVADLLDATGLFEDEATVAAVYQQVARARVVHVAAHGHSRADAPLFSHIRLANGALTALDCLNLTLDCELVTLSACETGHAVVAAGDEPIGLTRSLLYAGARSVIQSLWRVDDEATRRLMTDMYGRLKEGAGRGAALRAAQQALLGSHATADGYAHPAFWAAFELVGDWSPLK